MKRWLQGGVLFAGVGVGSAVIFLILLDFVVLPAIVEVPMVTVPDVLRLSAKAARQRVSAKGLRLLIRDSVYSERAATGEIVDQDPAPGQRIKRARRVFVDISRGRRLYDVPDVTGGSQREAGLQLQGGQLVVGRVRFASHTRIPQGVVIRQDPSAGKKVPLGTRVDLQISSGSPTTPKRIPNLVGLSIEVVEDTLRKYELRLGQIENRIDNQKPVGTVLAQTPDHRQRALRRSRIDLVLSMVESRNVNVEDAGVHGVRSVHTTTPWPPAPNPQPTQPSIWPAPS